MSQIIPKVLASSATSSHDTSEALQEKALMIPSHDAFFVVLSVIVAVLASFAALDLAGRVRSEGGATRPGWIAGGGIVMGLGIWSMHFIGMLAFHLPVPISYDVPLMLLSVGVAIAASLLALAVINRPALQLGTLVPAGVLMGGAIAGMHYIGMASMRAEASLSYTASIVAMSVLIAVVASLAALWLCFRFRSDLTVRGTLLKMLSAVVMGLAISGMHYTGMAAARFAPGGAIPVSIRHVLASGRLDEAVVASAVLIIVLAIIAAVIDRNVQAARAAFSKQLGEQTLELRQSEQRLRLILDNALDAVITMGPSGVITDWNGQGEKMFGWSRAEALGQQMSATIIPERYREHHDRGLQKFLATGVGPVLNKRIEITALRRDGTEFPVELAISPAKVGEEWMFSAFIRDLTGRVEAERALHASERRLVQILEAVPLGIIVADATGQIVFANAGGQKTLGSGVVPSVGAGETAQIYPAYVAGTDQFYPNERMPLVRALAGEASAVDDMEIHRGDELVSLSVKGAPILDTEGKVVSAVVAFIDTTERKSLEGQVRQASKMEAVGQLAGGVAHDFNNLLTVIMSYSSMLLDRLAPDDDNREDVQEIAAAADRAAALTRQLLAFSRKQVMQPRIMDINTVISDVENMLRRIIGEDIELQITLDPSVKTINADPGQLQQVLMNLVVNARDAMPSGGRLSVSTSNSRLSVEAAAGALRAHDGEYVVLTVSDTGTGMTREVQRRLFDPFFTTKDQGRGTGLGLSTVYGIVKQSGGEIFVYSELGEGSSFNVYFPRFAATLEHHVPVVKPVVEVPRGSETVLLVEDDANVRSLATRVLRRYGYKVLVATGGVEALAIASDPTTLIDLVVTDVVMPGINGRELLEQLVESRPGMGTLLMSGYTDDDVLRRGVAHGETAFLQKPFTPEQLARKIRDVLDHPVIHTAA